MSGPLALHGGAEFTSGDEPFLEALLEAAARRVGRGRAIRVAVVPTAAARGHPDAVGAYGIAAFERVATGAGLVVEATTVAVVDAASAADGSLADRLAAADVIHLPGGDPDLIPTILPGSVALAAITRAWADGAVLAGASAGAMALAQWTWTPAGGMPGLGLVSDLLVVPHADAARWADAVDRFGAAAPAALGALGLAERTGVLADEMPVGGGPILWTVVGPGEVRWLLIRSGETLVARAGDTFRTGLPSAYEASTSG